MANSDHLAFLIVAMPVLLVSMMPTAFASSSKPKRILEGRTLRCCTLLEGVISFQNEKRKPFGFDGLAHEHLALLQERLGFQCKSLSLYKNGREFSEFIMNMDSCTENGSIKNSSRCNCDIGVAGWMPNSERLGRVDYLPFSALDEIRVYTHIDNTAASTGGTFFITAFTGPVWLCITGLVFFFSFLKMLDTRFAMDSTFKPLPPDFSRFRRWKHVLLKGKILYRLRKAIQSSRNTSEIRKTSTRHWVTNFVMALVALFIVLAYEATMTASLVKETTNSDFRSINDFINCRIPASDVCLVADGAIQIFWENAVITSPCHEEGHKKTRYFRSYETMIPKIISKECKFALALRSEMGRETSGRYCGKIVQAGKALLTGGLSIVLPRGSDLTTPLSNATLQLHQDKSIPTLAQYFSRGDVCSVSTSSSLSLGRLYIFFIMAYGACFLIFLEMILDPQTAQPEVVEKSREQMENDSDIVS